MKIDLSGKTAVVTGSTAGIGYAIAKGLAAHAGHDPRTGDNPMVYAEISLSFSTLEALERVIGTMTLTLREIPRPALFLAAGPMRSTAGAAAARRRCCPTFSSMPTRPWKAGFCSRATPAAFAPISRGST